MVPDVGGEATDVASGDEVELVVVAGDVLLEFSLSSSMSSLCLMMTGSFSPGSTWSGSLEGFMTPSAGAGALGLALKSSGSV